MHRTRFALAFATVFSSALALPLSVRAQTGLIRLDTISKIIVGPEQNVQATIVYRSGAVAVDTLLPGVVRPLGNGGVSTLHVSPCLRVGNVLLREGYYSLWLQRGDADATLVINSLGGLTDTSYDPKYDIGRIPLRFDSLPTLVTSVTPRIRSARTGPDELGLQVNRSGTREAVSMNSGLIVTLAIESGRSRWSVPLTAPDTVRHRSGPFQPC